MSDPTSQPPLRLFYSYSHKDETLRQRLDAHLKLLQRQKVIEVWHDRAIEAGQEWEPELKRQLDEADIILLLVSTDFLASDYCWGVETQQALQRHQAGTARVIPIILRPTDLTDAPFMHIQCLPREAKPVITWTIEDEAWTNVTQGIRQVATTLRRGRLTLSTTVAGQRVSVQMQEPPSPINSRNSLSSGNSATNIINNLDEFVPRTVDSAGVSPSLNKPGGGDPIVESPSSPYKPGAASGRVGTYRSGKSALVAGVCASVALSSILAWKLYRGPTQGHGGDRADLRLFEMDHTADLGQQEQGEINYFAKVVRSNVTCDPKKARNSTTTNILETPTYMYLKMQPHNYGKAVINPEVNRPGYYRIQTDEQCDTENGNTHGGFKYILDYDKITMPNTYTFSFCAWSVSDDEVNLAIEHTSGSGQVSNLSRTAILTREPHIFQWEGRLDGSKSSKAQTNLNHRFLFGFVFDYKKSRACDPGDIRSSFFAKKEFVIGDVRLEMVPEPAAKNNAPTGWVGLGNVKSSGIKSGWGSPNDRYCNDGPCHLLVYAGANKNGDGTPLSQTVEYPIPMRQKPQNVRLTIDAALDDGKSANEKEGRGCNLLIKVNDQAEPYKIDIDSKLSTHRIPRGKFKDDDMQKPFYNFETATYYLPKWVIDQITINSSTYITYSLRCDDDPHAWIIMQSTRLDAN